MNWVAEAYKLISKFFVGYGGGFSAVIGFGASIQPESITLFNLLIYPTLSGLVTVFPQLTKTFAEASRR